MNWRKTLGGIVALGWDANRVSALTVAVLCVGQQGGGLVLALWLAALTDAATSRDRSLIIWEALFAGGTIAAVMASFVAGWRYRLRLREEIDGLVDRRLMRRFGAHPTLDLHEDRATTATLEVLQRQRAALGGAFEAMMSFVGQAAQMLGSVVLLAYAVPWLLLLPLFSAPALLAAHRSAASSARAWQAAGADLGEARELLDLVAAAPEAQEVRAYGLGATLKRRQAIVWTRAGAVVGSAEGGAALLSIVAWTVFVAAFAVAVVLIVRAAEARTIGLGITAAALVIASQISAQMSALVSVWTNFARSLQTVERYLLLVAPAPASPAPQLSLPGGFSTGIRLSNVGFAYRGSDRFALRHVDVFLPVGAVVAIVGENGAGKTTLVKLLSGMHHPTEGDIFVDGLTLSGVPAEAWRSKVTCSFQDFVQFELTVQHAVGVGRVQDRDDEMAVRAALGAAAATGVLDQVGHRMDTRLGDSWGGRPLSLGGWQQIALARGEMRQRPWLKLLDEPAASLDPAREEDVVRLLMSLAGGRRDGRVAVVVTHRFTTARLADLILVLEEGRLTERGNHHELMAQRGHYAAMYQMQMRQLGMSA